MLNAQFNPHWIKKSFVNNSVIENLFFISRNWILKIHKKINKFVKIIKLKDKKSIPKTHQPGEMLDEIFNVKSAWKDINPFFKKSNKFNEPKKEIIDKINPKLYVCFLKKLEVNPNKNKLIILINGKIKTKNNQNFSGLYIKCVNSFKTNA